jgi:hypothetical protein
MRWLARHRLWVLVVAAAVVAVAVSAWMGRHDRTYGAALDPGNPDGDGAQAVARVLDDQGIDVEVVRSADALDAGAADGPSAAELRRRAESALADGRHSDAVLDAFRAIAVRQVERGRLDDQPGATAHEVAASLATTYPDQGQRVGRGADLFDATLYGARPAVSQDATALLDLDDTLAGTR